MADHDDASSASDVMRRLTALEGIVRHLEQEVTTHRLRVVDRQGRPRIVAEVVGDTAEVRVQVPDAHHPGRSHAVVYATPALSSDSAGDPQPSLGVALQVEGDIVAGLHHKT